MDDPQFYVYFSRPNDTVDDQPPIDPVRFGPFDEFLQVTYQELRSGPDGDALAWIDATGVWRIRGDRSETEADYWYSDLVVSFDGDLDKKTAATSTTTTPDD